MEGDEGKVAHHRSNRRATQRQHRGKSGENQGQHKAQQKKSSAQEQSRSPTKLHRPGATHGGSRGKPEQHRGNKSSRGEMDNLSQVANPGARRKQHALTGRAPTLHHTDLTLLTSTWSDTWVRSSVARAIDCRSAGTWLNSRRALDCQIIDPPLEARRPTTRELEPISYMLRVPSVHMPHGATLCAQDRALGVDWMSHATGLCCP